MNRLKTIITVFLVSILQITIFSRLEISGASANISIPLIIVFALGFNEFRASYSGLYLGLIEDILFSPILGPRALAYFLLGFIVGDNAYRFNIKDKRTGAILTGLASLLLNLISVLIAHLRGPDLVLLETVKIILLGAIINGLLYYPVLKIANKIFVFPDIVFGR